MNFPDGETFLITHDPEIGSFIRDEENHLPNFFYIRIAHLNFSSGQHLNGKYILNADNDLLHLSMPSFQDVSYS